MPYPAYNVIVVCEMGLATLAAENPIGVEVDVVFETHFCACVRPAQLVYLKRRLNFP